MSRIYSIVLCCCISIIACNSPSKNDIQELKKSNKTENLVCFNHSLLVLDSVTYSEVINSTFLNRFAFSYERQLSSYKGFYLIGSTNYLELFHSKSMESEKLETGDIWICLASMKANYLKQLNNKELNFIKYESDDHYNYLSLFVYDSINPITTWEMTKKQYESWTKKNYNDSISFLPVDYNSPQESDSSSNYLMKDVIGIGLSLNSNDSLYVVNYLKEIGFDSYTNTNDIIRISNNDQFFELNFTKESSLPTINKYFIELNESIEATTEIIGNSRIECKDNLAIWYFNN